jgi:hypothetical protein
MKWFAFKTKNNHIQYISSAAVAAGGILETEDSITLMPPRMPAMYIKTHTEEVGRAVVAVILAVCDQKPLFGQQLPGVYDWGVDLTALIEALMVDIEHDSSHNLGVNASTASADATG